VGAVAVTRPTAADCSLVVLTWEDVEMTVRALMGVPAETEVVVVDNGSGPAVADRLGGECARRNATFVRLPQNLGYARGMNAGVEHARRGIVLLANNDIALRDGCVDALAAAFADPATVLAFPAVEDDAGRVVTPAGRFLTTARATAMMLGLTALFPRRLALAADPATAEWFSGPLVAVRRSFLAGIGGVPTASFMYAEDYRLCWVARQVGLPARYVPQARIWHADDASARKRWSADEIARRQTRELVRAAADAHRSAVLRRIVAWQFVVGAAWRYGLRRQERRRAVLLGALEGARSV
jgi:GT2 family glycosyltransferase